MPRTIQTFNQLGSKVCILKIPYRIAPLSAKAGRPSAAGESKRIIRRYRDAPLSWKDDVIGMNR
jgi:hypothetical protein